MNTDRGIHVNVNEYLRVLRRRWLLIVSCTVVVLAVAALLTVQATPQYSSAGRIIVSTASTKSASAPDTAYTGGLAATQRVTSYAALVTDGELTSRVIKAMDLDLTPAELARKIKADVVPDTTILQVQVTDTSARRARAIDAEVIDQLLDLIGEIETPPGGGEPLLRGTVVGPATLPLAPVTPQPVRNLLLGLVVGLLFGVAAAVARELLDTSVKTARQVEDTLHAPVLGGIANDPAASSTPLVTSLSSHAPRAEAFRVLRTNLQFIDVDSRHKVYVITSSVPAEGKSTTAVNVAIAMAQAGQRILLLDGDLRRPQVAELLGLEGSVGLTTVLLGRVDVSEALQEHGPSGLTVLTSGLVPPNPAELLQSHAMHELLEQLRASFDVVIIDSPPLLPVTDAALMASRADGAVLVVRHGRTTRDQLAGANERLEGVGARVLGAVFNRLKTGRHGGDGFATGYGYGYGYGPTADAPVEQEPAAVVPSAVMPAAVVPVPEAAPVADETEAPADDHVDASDHDDDGQGTTGTSGRSGASVLSISRALRLSALSTDDADDERVPGRHRG